jgi:hypothetical protein
MFTRKPRLQLKKFAINGAKRLLQHNLPIAALSRRSKMRAQKSDLLDHLVGAGDEPRRHLEAEGFAVSASSNFVGWRRRRPPAPHRRVGPKLAPV